MEQRAPEIGGYRVLRKIGAGGIGVVYLAETSTTPPAQVALKLLHERTAFRADDVQRLLREARVGQSLCHAHILPVLAIERWRGQPVLVMDFVPGVTLARWKTDEGERHAALAEKLFVLASIADALAYAHRQGVIHRDVKPGNILVRDDGHPFLIDFGMARTLDVDSTITASGTVLGTPGYLPPEALADGGHLDFRSDVYSLGVCVFEAAAGRLPFKADSLPALLERIRHDEPPRLRELAPHAPPALDAIVERALEKKPQDRYASATELGEDLRRVALGLKPKTSRVSLWVNRELRALKRARLRIVAGIAVVSLVVLSAVGWGLASARDRLRRRDFEAALAAGYDHLDRGELQLALASFAAADGILPGMPEAELARANAFAEFRMWGRAGAAVQQARELGYAFGGDTPAPNDLFFHAIPALVDMRFDDARGDLERALAEDPTLFRAAFLLEPLYRRARINDRAREALVTCRRNLKEVDPRHEAVDALVSQLDGRFGDAIASLEALAAVPGAPRWVQSALGQALLAAHQAGDQAPAALERARAAFERATELEPWDAFSWSNLSVARYLQGEREAARLAAERALGYDDRVEDANRVLAALAAEAEDWADAERHLAAIQPMSDTRAALDGFRADVLYGSGLEDYQASRYEQAIAKLRTSVQLNPEHRASWFVLANSLWMTRDFPEGSAAFWHALQPSRDDAWSPASRLEPWRRTCEAFMSAHELDAHIGLLGVLAASSDPVLPAVSQQARRSLERVQSLLAEGAHLEPESAFNLAEALVTTLRPELLDVETACALVHEYGLLERFGANPAARETVERLKEACP